MVGLDALLSETEGIVPALWSGYAVSQCKHLFTAMHQKAWWQEVVKLQGQGQYSCGPPLTCTAELSWPWSSFVCGSCPLHQICIACPSHTWGCGGEPSYCEKMLTPSPLYCPTMVITCQDVVLGSGKWAIHNCIWRGERTSATQVTVALPAHYLYGHCPLFVKGLAMLQMHHIHLLSELCSFLAQQC